jgi:hypothetical protein
MSVSLPPLPFPARLVRLSATKDSQSQTHETHTHILDKVEICRDLAGSSSKEGNCEDYRDGKPHVLFYIPLPGAFDEFPTGFNEACGIPLLELNTIKESYKPTIIAVLCCAIA